MSTRAQLLLGADFEGDEAFCDTVVNALKNHFRMSDPCSNMANRVPGEIVSDEDDDKLYHIGGESGFPCDEIIQESRSQDAVPILTSVELGNNHIRTNSQCRAYLNSSMLNLANNTWTKVLLDTENWDPGGIFKLANNQALAAVTGYYWAHGLITYIDVVAFQRYQASIYVNGISVCASNFHSGLASSLSVPIIDLIYVQAGQAVALYANQVSGGAAVDIAAGSLYTYLNLHLASQ